MHALASVALHLSAKVKERPGTSRSSVRRGCTEHVPVQLVRSFVPCFYDHFDSRSTNR